MSTDWYLNMTARKAKMTKMTVLKSIREKTNKKLSSTKGESITETLVALLISSLALVMLAGAISAASNMVTKTKQKLVDYYAANEVVVNMDGSGTSDTLTVKPQGGGQFTVDIYSYENNVFRNNNIVSYRKR